MLCIKLKSFLFSIKYVSVPVCASESVHNGKPLPFSTSMQFVQVFPIAFSISTPFPCRVYYILVLYTRPAKIMQLEN